MSAEQISPDEIVASCLPTLRYLTSRRIKKHGVIPRRFVVLDFLDSLGLVLGRMAHAEFDFPNPEDLMGSTRREIGSEEIRLSGLVSIISANEYHHFRSAVYLRKGVLDPPFPDPASRLCRVLVVGGGLVGFVDLHEAGLMASKGAA